MDARETSKRTLADELEADARGRSGMGTPQGQRERAAEVRRMADEVDAKFGRGEPFAG